MRLATLAVAAVVLVGMSPALAHTAYEAEEGQDVHTPANGDHHEVTAGHPYADEILVEDDIYAKGGWWADGSFGEGLSVNMNGTHTTDQQVIWLTLKEGRDALENSYQLTVEVEGSALAAMDVFRLYENGRGITPDCPQYLAEELFPNEGEGLGYAFRVLRETTGHHQRAFNVPGFASPTADTMSVRLNPSEGPYAVAVYPQAATGQTAEDTTINATAQAFGDDQFVLRDDTRSEQQPELPYDTSQWVGTIDTTQSCADEGVALPGPLGNSDAAELPGTGPVDERVDRLLGTSIG